MGARAGSDRSWLGSTVSTDGALIYTFLSNELIEMRFSLSARFVCKDILTLSGDLSLCDIETFRFLGDLQSGSLCFFRGKLVQGMALFTGLRSILWACYEPWLLV